MTLWKIETVIAATVLLIGLASSQLFAQTPVAKRNEERLRLQMEKQAERLQQQMRDVAENPDEMPTDSQLLVLHKEFISKAEKLAAEYERKKQFDKAREVYTSLVRLVPNYTLAQEGLSRILSNQSAEDRQLMTVQANLTWQDSGATLSEGMPVHIEVKGTWKVVYETGPEGIEIPEELRPRDNRIKLGTLIAVVANSPKDLAEAKPFPIADGQDFIAKQSGRLFLRMYDVDPTDNDGKMLVMIQSTFSK